MKGILLMLKIIVAYTNLSDFNKLDVHKFARLQLHAVHALFVEAWTSPPELFRKYIQEKRKEYMGQCIQEWVK